MVRRDRLRAPIWIAAIVGLVAASAASVVALYNTPAERAVGDLGTTGVS